MHTLSVIIPFFALVLIGYIAARSRFMPIESVPGLNTFVLYFALPAVLFQLAARTPVAQLIDPTTLSLWIISGLLIMTLAIATGLWRKRSWLDASFGGLISVFSNSTFLGIPVIVALVGEYAAGPIVTTLLVDIVVMQSVALAMSQQGTHGSAITKARTALVRVVTNPMLLAIVFGALWGLTGWEIPTSIDSILTILGAAATPVALFTIGAVLAREALRRIPDDRSGSGILAGDVSWLTSLKLLVHPTLVWLLGHLAIHLGLPLEAADLRVLVLVAGLPSAANVSMLAERLGADNGRIARVILLSTLIGFGTFAVVAMLA
ncbi:AEC family transporter [Leucobacter denitrificans]|uniref:AEC family transporter n=2 Tax=Leucobacter denitrificans TaxID=683042 RepID=A0A7G9S7K6_9MICO|nr:AEC family transporter [Leucobacter denitrificans]